MIRDRDKYRDSAWDWDFLDGCFGDTRIRPSDMDGITERKGSFLVLEAKGTGVPIPYGQGCLLEALSRLPTFTVIVLWGEPGNPSRMKVYPRAIEYCTVESVRAEVRAWYARAEGQQPEDGPAEVIPIRPQLPSREDWVSELDAEFARKGK